MQSVILGDGSLGLGRPKSLFILLKKNLIMQNIISFFLSLLLFYDRYLRSLETSSRMTHAVSYSIYCHVRHSSITYN